MTRIRKLVTTRNRIRTVLALAVVAMAILVLPAAAKEIPAQLPDPDGKAPDTTKPVKVYILAGQSNIISIRLGTTRSLPTVSTCRPIRNPPRERQFQSIRAPTTRPRTTTMSGRQRRRGLRWGLSRERFQLFRARILMSCEGTSTSRNPACTA
jgi:hypothetical protein